MNGFRISIQNREPHLNEGHYSGKLSTDHDGCACPNCSREMFAAFNLKADDPRVSSVINWKHEYLRVFHCPHCSVHLEDYEITADTNGFRANGGYCDGELANPNVDMPFSSAALVLEPLPSPYPTDKHRLRKAEGGIYHQLGGRPIWNSSAGACTDCGKTMSFIGIMDYDDAAVPLFENDGMAMAMIIGDLSCMNLYGCGACSKIRYRITKTP